MSEPLKPWMCGVPTKATGEACRHPKPCLHHGAHITEEQRLAIYGTGGPKPKVLPPDTEAPRFSGRSDVVQWAQETARLVLIGELDTKLADCARALGDMAMRAWALEAELRLAAIERHLRRKRIT